MGQTLEPQRSHTILTTPKAAVVTVIPPASSSTVTADRSGAVRTSRSACRSSGSHMTPPEQRICRQGRGGIRTSTLDRVESRDGYFTTIGISMKLACPGAW